MKKYILITALTISSLFSFAQADSSIVNKLLEEYSSQGAVSANAKQGKILWQKTFNNPADANGRSCSGCHTEDLTKTGKHIKTNKEIKPMSPLANPQRLTKIKKIKKWFKRNCKWTLGRECTAQEKSDLLVYIENQTKF